MNSTPTFNFTSAIQIGGYHFNRTRDATLESHILWTKQTDQLIGGLWSINVYGYIVGTPANYSNTSAGQYTGSLQGIIDSNYPYIAVPSYIYADVLTSFGIPDILQCPTNVSESDGQPFHYMCNCSHRENGTLPNITLYIADSYYVDLSPWTLLLDSSTTPSTAASYEALCRFALVNNTHNNYTWRLGIPFLRNYYAIFDEGGNRVGITPSVYSNATVWKGSTIKKPTKENLNTYMTSTTSSTTSYLEPYYQLAIKIA